MVGNGVTDWRVDTYPPLPVTGSQMDVFPKSLNNNWVNNGCKFLASTNDERTNKPEVCGPIFAQMLMILQNLNIYDLYRGVIGDVSLRAGSHDRYGETIIGGEKKYYKRGHTQQEYAKWLVHILGDSPDAPVLGDQVTDYMNLPETRAAFNIPDSVQPWSDCTNLNYQMQTEGSIWIYPVLRNKYRIMIYSGDTDGCVPTYGTKEWIEELGWEKTQAWRPILTNGQVSGYAENFDGLDFYTVKGVGHMAPQWARKPVTNMMMSWIHNEPI